MSTLKIFTFNPFQENTYIISNNNNECIIFDPGCWDVREQKEITDYINDNNLNEWYYATEHEFVTTF